MVIEQNRSLSLSVSSVPFGMPVKVSWKVPVDEATNKDWIGEKGLTELRWGEGSVQGNRFAMGNQISF